MSLGTPTVHKDLSLISLIPRWSGSDSTNSLEEFISTLEVSARIGRWEPKDTVEIAALKLEGSARVFYQGCTELHTRDASWNTFKEVFRKQYKDVHTDQYHYARLQMARKGKNESPQEFADRCRALAQRIKCQSDDPVAQGVHRENAERMLLASYVTGLIGVPGRQVRYASPVTVEEAIRIAVSVQEAERHEKFNNSFYARHDSRTYSDSDKSRHAVALRTASQAAGRRTQVPWSANKARASSTRNAQTKAALRCYECEGIGHFARESYQVKKGTRQLPIAREKEPGRAFKTFRVSRRKTPNPDQTRF